MRRGEGFGESLCLCGSARVFVCVATGLKIGLEDKPFLNHLNVTFSWLSSIFIVVQENAPTGFHCDGHQGLAVDSGYARSGSTSHNVKKSCPHLRHSSKKVNPTVEQIMLQSASSRSSGMTRPPVLNELRRNLDHYRPREQLLREAVQNTMDAGGTECDVFLDRNSYENSREPLLDVDEDASRLSLAEFQGPALVFRNDTVFTRTDWEAFKNLGEMYKETRPGDVGKFGLGAKSFLHVSDVIMVLSGEDFLLLDPTGHVFRTDASDSWEGTGWSTFEDGRGKPFRHFFEQHPGQFRPFTTFGATEDGYLQGTIIRLPLRTERHVRHGVQTGRYLKNESYAADEIEKWLADFPSEVQRLSIFLHSLKRLRVGVYEEARAEPHVGVETLTMMLEERSTIERKWARNRNNVFPRITKVDKGEVILILTE